MGAKKDRSGSGHQSRADRRRRGRSIGLWILGTAVLALAFFLVDRSGPRESISGVVVETRRWVHSSGDQQGEHTHVDAVLEFEDHRYTLERAGDRFRDGDLVLVEVRRGRITGFPYFVQAGRQ